MEKKKFLLIDGDELVYKAGFASQKTYHNVTRGEETLSRHKTKRDAMEWIGSHDTGDMEIVQEIVPGRPEQTVFALNAVMNTILADIRPHDYRLYLSGDNNFRIDIATLLPYKGTRSTEGRPFYYELIRERMVDEFYGIVVDGMEADDAMSITQWHHESNVTSWQTIIASQDKDLNMVPGLHYNPSKRKLYEMSPVDARFAFYCQLLSGDSTDNIPGVYRIGEKTAPKILKKLKTKSNKDMYLRVLKAYNDAQANETLREKMPGDLWGEQRIAEVGRLLWMLQDRDQVWKPGENYYARVGLS